METKLTLVNHLLFVTGERRVITLDTTHPSVAQAIETLDSVNREFQGRGWWFNTNKAMRLAPNNLGEVLLPDECLKFTVTFYTHNMQSPQEKARYARRGNKLYDSWQNTFKFNKLVVADLVLNLDVEELPQTAATYLKHYAAETFYLNDDGEIPKYNKLQERTLEAFHYLKAEALQNDATNALDSPTAQQLRYRIRSAGYSGNPNLPGGRVL